MTDTERHDEDEAVDDGALSPLYAALREHYLVEPAPSVAERHLAAMGAVLDLTGADRSAPAVIDLRDKPRRGRRAVIAGGVMAAVLVGSAGLAAAGVLPAPLQNGVAAMVRPVGLHLPSEDDEHAPNPSGGPSTPSTQGGASDDAPGRGGQNPGQSDGAPGQAKDPGQSSDAPGQGGVNPGQSKDAPGHGGVAPGQSEDAPGQGGDAPGKSEDAPGQTGETPGQGNGNGSPSNTPASTTPPTTNVPPTPPTTAHTPPSTKKTPPTTPAPLSTSPTGKKSG